MTHEITALLDRYGDGDRSALDELLPLVYDDLMRIAHQQKCRRSHAAATLNTTAIVHEAYIRFARGQAGDFEHRSDFFAVAAVAMRRILIDEARRHLRQKRGSGQQPLQLEDRDFQVDSQAEFLLALDRGLDRIEKLNPRLRKVVECRFFGGLTEDETAEVLQVTGRTVRRDWAKAKTLLAGEFE